MNAMEAGKNLLLGLGSDWILYFLGVLSVVSFAIIVERVLYFRTRSADLASLANRLDGFLSARDFPGAIDELQKHRSVAAAVAASGLRLAEKGPKAVEKAMDSAIALERGRLEKWLAYLGTVGNNAPFVGLFGTVIGVISAFEQLARQSTHAGASSGQIASEALMAAIAEALVATAVGIFVALPAVAAFNYFQRRMASLLQGTDVLSSLVLAYLSDDSAKKAE